MWGRATWPPPGSCPCPPGGLAQHRPGLWAPDPGSRPPQSGFSSTFLLGSSLSAAAVERGSCEGQVASGSQPQKSPGMCHLHPQLPAKLQEPRDLGQESLVVAGSGAAHPRPLASLACPAGSIPTRSTRPRRLASPTRVQAGPALSLTLPKLPFPMARRIWKWSRFTAERAEGCQVRGWQDRCPPGPHAAGSPHTARRPPTLQGAPDTLGIPPQFREPPNTARRPCRHPAVHLTLRGVRSAMVLRGGLSQGREGAPGPGSTCSWAHCRGRPGHAAHRRDMIRAHGVQSSPQQEAPQTHKDPQSPLPQPRGLCPAGVSGPARGELARAPGW